ncbi:MAG: MBL fold metallo-hydrolase [Candidatus Binatia bacterium]
MTPVFDPIRCFTADNPGMMTLEGTNQYLLGREEITVIDVALASKENVDGILEQAEAMGGKKVEKILLTHIHRDHSGGALELKRRCGAKLGISRVRAGYLGGEDFGYGDGDRLPYDGGELIVVHTPGHESGHCCFYEPEQQILFTGDHILGRGTTVIPPPDGDMALYIQSLEKLLDLKIRLLLPGHGPSIGDPYGKIREYIDHRVMREKQVLQCLRDGHHTIGSMAEVIYKDLSHSLIRMGGLTVEAHLSKLVGEKRVDQKGRDYYLVGDG